MWFIISLLVIIPGLISMTTRGLNFGILPPNAKIVENPSAYGANGFVLFDAAADGKAVK